VHYPDFLGGHGLTFDSLLNIPLFSVHRFMTKMSYPFISHSFTHSVSLHELCNLVTRVPFPLSNYPKALYLFTRSDLKTIVLPVVCLPLIIVPPHNKLFLDCLCLSLSLRHYCRAYAMRSIVDMVAPSSVLRLESESEPRGGHTEQTMASHSFGHRICG
jgi:hypothetical protein